MTSWRSWQLDPITWLWIGWIVQFAVYETYGIIAAPRGDTLTEHLRPIFLSTPILWWVTVGLWLWLGVHFLAPAIERGLLELVRG